MQQQQQLRFYLRRRPSYSVQPPSSFGVREKRVAEEQWSCSNAGLSCLIVCAPVYFLSKWYSLVLQYYTILFEFTWLHTKCLHIFRQL